ncbi:MAG TPA: HlyD family secretion protein [Bryobacteraceae bacterium]|nr:HlyD family secretion protein [Bryobacteraceae bacterium]
MPDPIEMDPQAVHDEQIRLRAELDLLRRQYQDLQKEVAQKNAPSKDEGGGDKDDEGNKEGKGDRDDKDDKEKEKPKPPFFTRVRRWIAAHPVATIAIVIGLIILVIAAILLLQYLGSYESTDDAEIGGHTDPISSRISGEVVGVYIEDTQHLKKGQVVADLDPRDYEVALAQARANLLQAEASLKSQAPNVPITTTAQQTEARTAELDVASAEAALTASSQNSNAAIADLKQAEATLANAERDAERYRLLDVKQEVPHSVYDQKVTEADVQRALVASRRSSADAARKAVDERQAALDQAKQRLAEVSSNLPRTIAVQSANVETRQAAVRAAKSQVDQALLNLSYCKIVAPADGIVGNKTVEVGQHLAPGQELFALTQTNDVWVTANFKETQVREMRPGQSVSISVDALSRTFDGYVEALPGATGAKYSLLPPENATGNYVKVVQRLPVRIRFKSGQSYLYRLHPGMSVEPKVWIYTR